MDRRVTMSSQSNEGPGSTADPSNNNNDGATVIPTMTAQPPSQAPVANATTEGDNVTSGAAAVTPEGNRVTTTPRFLELPSTTGSSRR